MDLRVAHIMNIADFNTNLINKAAKRLTSMKKLLYVSWMFIAPYGCGYFRERLYNTVIGRRLMEESLT